MSLKEKYQDTKGIYLLPNLFTTAGLFAGFYAVIAATRGDFESAAIAVFIAMIMDGFDGRVARMLGAQSAFGAEYDSLADMVSFGMAPALVMYHWSLVEMGKAGWLVAFIYVACAALRLARFNTQLDEPDADKGFFQGLASPAAAACLMGWVWLGSANDLNANVITTVGFFLTFICGALMVSTVRYYSFKGIDLHGKVPFVVILMIVFIFALISLDPPIVLFSIFAIYTLSGPVFTLNEWRKNKQVQE